MIEFGEWLPDLPDYKNTGATEAKNVIPHGKSYREFPSLAIYSDALTARAQGIDGGRAFDGTVALFAGDATKLYQISDVSWSDVSQVGNYTCASDSMWQFAQWGEKILATQIADPIQTFTINTSTKFADLAASAPQARYITRIGSFVVVGNTYDTTDGNKPTRVRWCAVNDPSDWVVSASTQADYEDRLNAKNGWVQGVVGGEYGVIFQERAINLMTYVGSPVVFRFDEVETKKGTPAPGSIQKFGSYIAYLGEDDFYIFDGQRSQEIGQNKIAKTFYSDLDQNNMHRITSAVDPINQIIFWSYPGSGSAGGTPNKILMFNYSKNAMKRWSYAEVNVELISRVSVPTGYTLDTLDTVSSSIDDLSISLDSRTWVSNSTGFVGFDTDHKLNFFTGSALDATIETQEEELTPGNRTRINKIKPLVDGSGTVTVQVGTRNKLSESVTWGLETSLNGTGDACLRSNARYQRARVKISGGFNHAQGIDIVGMSGGGRR